MATVNETVYRSSLTDPAGFWAQAARDIEWIKPAERVLDDSVRRSTDGLPVECSIPATTRSTGISTAVAATRWRSFTTRR